MTKQLEDEAVVTEPRKITDDEWTAHVKHLAGEFANVAEEYLTEQGVEYVIDTATVMLSACDKLMRAVDFGYQAARAQARGEDVMGMLATFEHPADAIPNPDGEGEDA